MQPSARPPILAACAGLGGDAMRHGSLESFLVDGVGVLARGPVALLLIEDAVELGSTLRHALDAGFRAVVAFGDPAIPLPREADDPRVHAVGHDMRAEGAWLAAVNGAIAMAPPGTWLSYFHNAEYLFYPFCEHRSIGEMCTFATEERRDWSIC